MVAPFDVATHLQTEFAAADPWKLATNPFEQRRYDAMLDMVRARAPFHRALEVGCAAGVFTEQLVKHCDSLHVIDVMPQAIDRVKQRLSGRVTGEVASVVDHFAPGQMFDLIVVAEVLCYLPDIDALRRAIATLSSRLEVGGLLVFGSAVDETCARWGLFGGAETAMGEWQRLLHETGRTSCTGSYWGENSRIVGYTRCADSGDHKIIPNRALSEIPAKKALVLAPHPDDEVFGCGGAILKHVGAGVPVRVVVATDGGLGLTGAARSQYCAERFDESRAASEILGYGAPEFWNIPDRTLSCNEDLIARILSAMDGVDLVYAPSLRELHADHRALGMAAVEAVRRCGHDARLALYEVSAPLQTNLLLDITDVAARKEAATALFSSQLVKRNYGKHVAALNTYRTYTLDPDVTSAEAFFLISAEELARDPFKLHRPEEERRLTEASLTEQMLRRSITGLELELREMRNSNSWRITAPLRAATEAVRGAVRAITGRS